MPMPKLGLSGEVQKGIKKKTEKANGQLPHLSELAEHFVNIAGGPQAMAKMLFVEWNAAKPGSLVRSRILDLVTRVWKFSTDSLRGAGDLGILSEDDIDRLLDDKLRSMAEEVHHELAGPDPDGAALRTPTEQTAAQGAQGAHGADPDAGAASGSGATVASAAGGSTDPPAAAAADPGIELGSAGAETPPRRKGQAPGRSP